MNATQLQGTPWHPEQMHRACKDGSKYCLYKLDNEICGCKASLFYKAKCVGKGECDEFESKGNCSVKSKSNIQVVYHPERRNKKKVKIDKVKEEKPMQVKDKTQSTKSAEGAPLKEDKKQENFLRLSKDRVNKILKDIEILDNLSNRNSYHYTDEQVNKMFSCIEQAVAESKKHFKEKKAAGKFDW